MHSFRSRSKLRTNYVHARPASLLRRFPLRMSKIGKIHINPRLSGPQHLCHSCLFYSTFETSPVHQRVYYMAYFSMFFMTACEVHTVWQFAWCWTDSLKFQTTKWTLSILFRSSLPSVPQRTYVTDIPRHTTQSWAFSGLEHSFFFHNVPFHLFPVTVISSFSHRFIIITIIITTFTVYHSISYPPQTQNLHFR